MFSGASWEIKWALKCAKAHPPGGFLEWIIENAQSKHTSATSFRQNENCNIVFRDPTGHTHATWSDSWRCLAQSGNCDETSYQKCLMMTCLDRFWQDWRAEPRGHRLDKPRICGPTPPNICESASKQITGQVRLSSKVSEQVSEHTSLGDRG